MASLPTCHRILISCIKSNSNIDITVDRGVSRITKKLSPNYIQGFKFTTSLKNVIFFSIEVLWKFKVILKIVHSLL